MRRFCTEDARRLREQGWTLKRIAARYGVSKQAVSARLNRQDIRGRRRAVIQARICQAIDAYWAVKDRAPTLREIAQVVGMSPTATRNHVVALRAQGRLTYDPYKSRTLQLTTVERGGVSAPLVQVF